MRHPRRNLLKLAALGPLAGLPAFAAGLPNQTRAPGDATLRREPYGELRTYFEGSTAQLRSMTAGSLLLKPGQEPHPPHSHPEEEFVLVTEGQGEIIVDGQTTRVAPGAMMYCAANVMHGIRNTGRKPLLFYFYKWLK